MKDHNSKLIVKQKDPQLLSNKSQKEQEERHKLQLTYKESLKRQPQQTRPENKKATVNSKRNN